MTEVAQSILHDRIRGELDVMIRILGKIKRPRAFFKLWIVKLLFGNQIKTGKVRKIILDHSRKKKPQTKVFDRFSSAILFKI